MEFIEGSGGIYKPIRVLFETPIYERAKQVCWHTQAFKTKVAFMTELLHLQQNNQLPPEVTAEAMSDLMVRDCQKTVRVQLWDFELEGYDKDVKPLLKLAMEVNTSMMQRDVEFEAKRLLHSPDAMPPSFKHPKIISQAHEYRRILIKQSQRAPVTRKLSPQKVVVDLVPKVLQNFWRPKKTISRDMPSERLCEMAVSVTKAVLDQVSASLSKTFQQVDFPKSRRDNMVHAIDQKIKQKYSEYNLRRKLNNFEVEVLNIITSITVESICVLFEPQTQEERPADQPPDVTTVQDSENISQGTPSLAASQDLPAVPCTKELRIEPDSAGRTPSPPAYLPTSLPAEANVTVSVPEGEMMEGQSTREPALTEPPTLSDVIDEDAPLVINTEPIPGPDPEPDSAGRTPSPPAYLPTSLPAEANVVVSVPEGEMMEGQSTREPALTEPPTLSDVIDEYAPLVINTEPIPGPDPEPDSAGRTPSPPAYLPTSLPPEAHVTVSVLEGEMMEGQSTREPALTEPPTLSEVIAEYAPLVVNTEPIPGPDPEPDSAGRTPSPPAYLPTSLPAVANVTVSVLEGKMMEGQSIREPALTEPPTLSDVIDEDVPLVVNTEPIPGPDPEPDSAGRTPSPPAYLPTSLPAVANVAVSVLEGEMVEGQSTREPALTEPPTLTEVIAEDALLVINTEPIPGPDPEPDSAGQTPSPPAYLPTSLPAVAYVKVSVLEGEMMEGQSTREPALTEPPTLSDVIDEDVPLVSNADPLPGPDPEPDSAGRTPSLPAYLPTSLPAVANVTVSVPEGEMMEGQSTQTQDRVPKSRIQRFFRRIKKRICCCVLPQDDH